MEVKREECTHSVLAFGSHKRPFGLLSSVVVTTDRIEEESSGA